MIGGREDIVVDVLIWRGDGRKGGFGRGGLKRKMRSRWAEINFI